MATEQTTPSLVPPQNLEAEESVLGAMMVSESAIEPVILDVRLQADDFYRDRHRTIFEAILGLRESDGAVDVLTVAEALAQQGALEAIGGRDVVASLAARVPAAGNARHYARIVKQNALMRRLDAAAKRIQQSVAERDGEPNQLVENAERLLFQVAHEERAADFKSLEDVLHSEWDRLQLLHENKTELIGTTSGFKELDDKTGGFQKNNLVVIAARPSMGKCQPGSALVYNAGTGARERLDELVARHEAGEEIWVAAVGSDLKIRPARISDAIRSGRQRVYRLTTKLGRRVEATANHPLLTFEGWRPLGELSAGARIAVPRILPRPDPGLELRDHELVLLAALIADGSIIRGTPLFTFGPDSPVLDEVEQAAEAIGVGFNRGPDGRSAYLSNGYNSGPNPVTELCVRHGVWGKRSDDKFIPDAIFQLPDHQIARFLSVLWACDGHIHVTDRLAQAGYSTISERLARDVQHLLLRFGIVSKIRTLRRDVYEGTKKVAREVRVTEQWSLARLCTYLRICGKEERQSEVMGRLGSVITRTNIDTVPSEAWEQVLAAKGEQSWANVSVAAGYPRNHNWHVGTRGLSRPRLLLLSEVLDSSELERLAISDVWWDEVESIEPIGEEETYDLTVPDHHNFVADDVIVHNSAIVCNIAENAAMKAGKTIALFSLEMSESELAQRFLASQARISSDRLRKGTVSKSDWPKVVDANNRLAEAPLWIDDSSDLGLLELRAKARRLAAQEHGAGRELGLIIVDYIQLIRADDPRANRVEQVSQFSRGLKLLSGELDVPVIAVSQLSRAPEQRPDKRPILSDLRESGAIEQDSDLVMFLYRDEYYNPESEDQGVAELHIAKHRNGPIGTVKLVFLSHYPKFANMTRAQAPVEQRAPQAGPLPDIPDFGEDGDADAAEEG